MDTHSRSIAKAISYRILGSLATASVAAIVTGQAGLGAAIGGADFVIKLGLYYFHERLWNLVPLGRVEEEETTDNALLRAESVKA